MLLRRKWSRSPTTSDEGTVCWDCSVKSKQCGDREGNEVEMLPGKEYDGNSWQTAGWVLIAIGSALCLGMGGMLVKTRID